LANGQIKFWESKGILFIGFLSEFED